MKRYNLMLGLGAILLVTTYQSSAADRVDEGKKLFATNCAACHNADASGIPGMAPPLSNALKQKLSNSAGKTYLSNVLVHGLAGPIVSEGQPFNGVMPAFATLSDDNLSDIFAWLGRLNGQDGGLTADQFAAARADRKTPGAVRKLREALK